MTTTPRLRDDAPQHPNATRGPEFAGPAAHLTLVSSVDPSPVEYPPDPAPAPRTSGVALTGFGLTLLAALATWAPLGWGSPLPLRGGMVRPLELAGMALALVAAVVWWRFLRRPREGFAGTGPLLAGSGVCALLALCTIATIAIHGVHPVEYLRGYRTGGVGSTLTIHQSGHDAEITLIEVSPAPPATPGGPAQLLARFRHTNRGVTQDGLTSLGEPQLLADGHLIAPALFITDAGIPARDVTLTPHVSVDTWATYVVGQGEDPQEVVIRGGHWNL